MHGTKGKEEEEETNKVSELEAELVAERRISSTTSTIMRRIGWKRWRQSWG